ncbi:MAG TPA: hypothetical protein VHE30_07685 [Polyangiaceae bacterium]|nr:hypothetical protein [Polyangiaceae bacterium]
MSVTRAAKWTVATWAAAALVACGSSSSGTGAPPPDASTGGSAAGGASGSGGAGSGGGPAGGSVGSGGTSTGGSSANGGASAGGASSGGGGPGGESGDLASQYPGDVGIASDPDVIWAEDFEEDSVATLLARYDDSKPDGLSLDADVPAKSSGKASGKLTANGAGPNAVDFFKRLPDVDELWVRYYAKYEANVPWHHTGVWIGGYNPPTSYPNPQAGLKPNGDDRFAVSLEPMEQNTAAPRMDTYDYWMTMHSWMDVPSGDTAYYGNAVIHDPTFTAKDTWQCFEVHIKLNPDPASALGAELGAWLDDRTLAAFTDSAPLGYWVKDKFCMDAAVGTECTDYRPANPTLVPLDLQYRNTSALRLNYFWPQNYITDAGGGSVHYDDMVLAKRRIGCIR